MIFDAQESADFSLAFFKVDSVLCRRKRGAGNDLQIKELLRKRYGLREWFSALFCPGLMVLQL